MNSPFLRDRSWSKRPTLTEHSNLEFNLTSLRLFQHPHSPHQKSLLVPTAQAPSIARPFPFASVEGDISTRFEEQKWQETAGDCHHIPRVERGFEAVVRAGESCTKSRNLARRKRISESVRVRGIAASELTASTELVLVLLQR